MIAGAKYGHTNLIAKDWRALARFYEEQFGCTPVPPERDFKGPDLERGTGIPGVELRGAHLRLPGYGPDGPTLEVFNYNILKEKPDVAVNRPGASMHQRHNSIVWLALVAACHVGSSRPVVLPAQCTAANGVDSLCGASVQLLWTDSTPTASFPHLAQMLGAQGDVHIEFSVLPNGGVEDASIKVRIAAAEYFGEALRPVIAYWRFQPFQRDSLSYTRRVLVIYGFRQNSKCTGRKREAVWSERSLGPMLTVMYCIVPTTISGSY